MKANCEILQTCRNACFDPHYLPETGGVEYVAQVLVSDLVSDGLSRIQIIRI